MARADGRNRRRRQAQIVWRTARADDGAANAHDRTATQLIKTALISTERVRYIYIFTSSRRGGVAALLLWQLARYCARARCDKVIRSGVTLRSRAFALVAR